MFTSVSGHRWDTAARHEGRHIGVVRLGKESLRLQRGWVCLRTEIPDVLFGGYRVHILLDQQETIPTGLTLCRGVIRALLSPLWQRHALQNLVAAQELCALVVLASRWNEEIPPARAEGRRRPGTAEHSDQDPRPAFGQDYPIDVIFLAAFPEGCHCN